MTPLLEHKLDWAVMGICSSVAALSSQVPQTQAFDADMVKQIACASIKTTTPSNTGTLTPAKLHTCGAGGVWGFGANATHQQYLVLNTGNTTDTAYAGSAKRDCGYGFTGGDNLRVSIESRIYDLDPSKTYKFTFFASSNTANSQTRYTVNGSNSGTADLDCRPSGVPNSTGVAIVTGISPTAQGLVTITTTGVPASNGQHCLGIIDIEVL